MLVSLSSLGHKDMDCFFPLINIPDSTSPRQILSHSRLFVVFPWARETGMVNVLGFL